MKLVHAAASLACTGMRRSSSALWDGGFSSAVWDWGVLITMLLGLIGWVLPPSRMPAAGTSAPEPDSTWPLAQPSSCTFGGYTEHAAAWDCSTVGWSTSQVYRPRTTIVVRPADAGGVRPGCAYSWGGGARGYSVPDERPAVVRFSSSGGLVWRRVSI